MIPGPLIQTPCEKIDHALGISRSTFRTPLAPIVTYRQKIESVLSKTINTHRTLLGMTVLSGLLFLGGCEVKKIKESNKNLPATIEFEKSPLYGFDV